MRQLRYFLVFLMFFHFMGCGEKQHEKSTEGETSVSLDQQRSMFESGLRSLRDALSVSVSFERSGLSAQSRNLLIQGPLISAQYPIVAPPVVPEFIRLWFPRGLEAADLATARATAEVGGQEVDLRVEPGPQSGEITVHGIQNLLSVEKPMAVLRIKVSSPDKEVRLVLRQSVAALNVRSFALDPQTEGPLIVNSTADNDTALVVLRRYEFTNPTNAELFLKLMKSPRGGLFLQYAKVTPYQKSRCEASQHVEKWRYRATTKFLIAPSGSYPTGSLQNQVTTTSSEEGETVDLTISAHATVGVVLYAVVNRNSRDLMSTVQCRSGASVPLVSGCTKRCSWWVPTTALVACGGSIGGTTNEIVKACLRGTGHGSSFGDYCIEGYSEDLNPVSYFNESQDLTGRAVEWDGAAPIGAVYYRDIPASLQRGTVLQQGFEPRLLISGEVDNDTPIRLEALSCR